MGATRFNDMEVDAIGEIMNISLGASATALSTLLGSKVNITTPVVSVQAKDEFQFRDLEPAVGVEITYVKGLDGKNVMMFSRNDVRIIVSTMMGMEIPEEEFQMDEMNESAIREVMNQMMGSSATALSEFLGTTVDISTPVTFEVPSEQSFKDRYFPDTDMEVVVRFTLEIEGKLESEFLNIMSTDLVKRLLQPFAEQFGLDLKDGAGEAPAAVPEAPAPTEPEPYVPETPPTDNPIDQSEIDALLNGGAQAPAPAAAEPASSGGGTLDQSAIDALLNGGSSAPAEPAPAAASGKPLDQAATDALLAGLRADTAPAPQPAPTPTPAPAPAVAPAPAAAPAPQPVPMAAAPVQYAQPVAADPMMLQILNQMQQSQTQMMQLMKQMEEDRKQASAAKREPRENALVRPMNSQEFSASNEGGYEEAENKEMLMKIPLEISVEIGRTKKLVKDILEFTQGSLVVLDKMAGEQADLYVNGECIAKGDIVVVEDNFGIRITEIVTKDINPESL